MLLSDTVKQLLFSLADGHFHSSAELAKDKHISRSAIWKHLQYLSTLGLELIAVSGKGYKLPFPLQLLEINKINQFVNAHSANLIHKIELHDIIDSTNNYLLKHAKDSKDSGWICIAEHQTAGKGRRGKSWVSPFGHNIYFSILWYYQDSPSALSGLSLALGVAVVKALQEFGLKEIGLKWPNDVYVNEKKLAGILVEVSGESSGPCHAVIGLGLNFYLSPKQADHIDQPWTDLYSILGSDSYTGRNKLIGLLLSHMLPTIANFSVIHLQNYINEWRLYDCMQGKEVTLRIGNQSYLGQVLGIDDQGLLQLAMQQQDNSDHSICSFSSGEVSLRV